MTAYPYVHFGVNLHIFYSVDHRQNSLRRPEKHTTAVNQLVDSLLDKLGIYIIIPATEIIAQVLYFVHFMWLYPSNPEFAIKRISIYAI